MDEDKLLELIQSWENSYISPSAQIVFRDARLLVASKNKRIKELEDEIQSLSMGNGGDDICRNTVALDKPEPEPAPRKLRGKKSPA